MRAPILAPARDKVAGPSIERHVENATEPTIDATESVVHEATRRLIEVAA